MERHPRDPQHVYADSREGAAGPYPKPEGIEQTPIQPSHAAWDPELGEFALPYEDVRGSSSPEDAILQFLESTSSAGVRLLRWDRGLVG